MVAVIIWIACAIWCYALAQKQGRNPLIGGALGLLLGFIAVIGYYIAGNKK